MGRENGKTGRCKSRASQLARFLHREGRKYCAVALCASLIAGSIGNMAIAADESTSNEHEFELSRVALYEALQEAVLKGNTLEKSFTFTGEAADTYDSLLDADGSLYELTPEIEDNDGALQLRIFARLDGEIELESAYDIDGSEEMIFLLTNSSDVEKRAVIHVDDKVTEEIKVAPKSAVLPGDLVNPYKSAAEAAGGPGAAANGETAAADAGEAIVINGGGVSSGGGSGSGGGGGSSSGGKGGSDVVVLDPTDEGKETETQENQDAAESNDAADETGASEVPEETENNEKADGTVQEDPNDKAEAGEDKDSDAGKEDQKEDDAVDTGSSDVDISIDTGNGNDTNQGSEEVAEDSKVSVDEPEQAEAEGQNAADSADPENTDGNDGDTAGENVSATISYHKTYLVTATPSDAEDEEEEATPSDATDSDAEKNQLDGMVYDVVCANGDAVVAFVTTAEDLGLTELTDVYEEELDDVIVKATVPIDTFSEDVILSVVELMEEDEDGKYQRAKDALDRENTDYDGMMAFDICFLNQDGDEVEPKKNVQIEIRMKTSTLPENVDSETLTVQHHTETENGTTKIENVAESIKEQSIDIASESNAKSVNGTVELKDDEIVADFAVESFSTFTITWTIGSGNSKTNVFEFTAHYIDESGNEIGNVSQGNVSLGNRRKINLKDYKKDIYGYNYVKVEHNSKEIVSMHSYSDYTWSETIYRVQFTYSDGSKKEVSSTDIYDKNIYYVYSAVENATYTVNFYENAYNVEQEKKKVGTVNNLKIKNDIVTVPIEGIAVDNSTMTESNVTYKFYGWSSNYNANYTAEDHVYSGEGEVIELKPSELGKAEIDLYGIWGTSSFTIETYQTVTFYIRLDGIIPYEPSSPPASKYSVGINIGNNVLKEYKHIYNDLSAVSNNLISRPSDNRIKNASQSTDATKAFSFDPATQEVVWYVVKYESTDGWHVDGVLRDKTKWNLEYQKNCDVVVENIIPNLQYSTLENAKVHNTVVPETLNQIDTAPVRAGYIFLGWNTKKDGSGDWYYAEDEIGPGDPNETITLYAQWQRDTDTHVVTKIWSDNNNASRKRPSSVTFEVTGTATTGATTKEITLNNENVDGTDPNKWSVEVTLDKTDEYGNPYTYSISEKNIPDGYEASVNGLTVTNTLKKLPITVYKVVRGNMGTVGAKFKFTYQIAGSSAVEFEVQDGDKPYVIEIPYGATVTVTETDGNTDGYKTYYKLGAPNTELTENEGKSYRYSALTASQTITFINDKTIDPPTGIFTNKIPYMFMIAISVLGMAGFALTDFKRRARRRRNQD